MPVIYCPINLFDADQKIYLVSDDGKQKEIAKTPLDYLDGTLVALCYEKQVYDIHLIGVRDFILDVVEDIQKTENLMFSQKRIKVEVN